MEPAFDQIFNLTSDAAFIDLDGRLVAVNQAALDLYDCELDDLIGVEVVDLVPSEFRQRLADRPQRSRDAHERPREDIEEILRADGTCVPVSLRSCPIEYDGQSAVLVLLRPVDDLHSVAELAARLDQRDQTFTDVSLQLAMASEHDLDATIERTLGAIAATEGADRAYVIEFDTEKQLISCTHEWCGPGVDPQIDYVQDFRTTEFPWSVGELLAGRVVHMPELSNLPAAAEAERQSFGQFGVRSVLQVPMLVAGQVIGLVGFNSLHRSVSWPDETIALVRRVCDATATALTRRRAVEAIDSGRKAAEEANTAKTSFLSRMSHELRTPLNAVLGFTELLYLDDTRTERDRQLLAQVLDSGRHLLGLVEDVLDISRIEAGGLSVSIETVDLADVVTSAAAIIEQSGQQSGVAMNLDRITTGSMVSADRQRVQQVVVNLLSNACKYNRPGGSVAVSTAQRGDMIELVVSDTGIGIAADALERVFEPFDRLGRENTGVEGVGIGLSLTRMLVDLMGGRISLTSVEGVGTDATVLFPAAIPVALDADTDINAGGPAAPIVLGVEDNEASSLLLRHVVERIEGVQFISVPSIADALIELRTRPPAVVLLDLHLADGNGEDLLARIRSDEATRSLPVIVVTANAEPAIRSRVTAAGADAFLAKPVPVATLDQAVRDAIGGRES